MIPSLHADILDKFRTRVKKNDNNNLIESYESKNFADKERNLRNYKKSHR